MSGPLRRNLGNPPAPLRLTGHVSCLCIFAPPPPPVCCPCFLKIPVPSPAVLRRWFVFDVGSAASEFGKPAISLSPHRSCLVPLYLRGAAAARLLPVLPLNARAFACYPAQEDRL